MKTYSLTPDQFAALRTRLLELGVTLPAEDDGTLVYQGITLGYHYDGATLTLKVQQKPFFVPTSMIWDQVDRWIAWA